MIDHAAITRGEAAQRELVETQKAFEATRDRIVRDWMDSKPDEAARREQLYLQIGLLSELRAGLFKLVQAGEYERHLIPADEANGA